LWKTRLEIITLTAAVGHSDEQIKKENNNKSAGNT
jgi:hypothetical protein